MTFRITAATPQPGLLDLPWRLPLEEWPEDILATLPRGISRHVVRFVRLGNEVLAIKEIKTEIAHREYQTLRNLNRLDLPCVVPYGVVEGRTDAAGEPLDACLITHHLQYSLPYRALFTQGVRKKTARRLIDALSVLLVRLHLDGFWWGDVSLSNTLFRRDAGSFAAYLVDAETGQLLPRLSDGQRAHDLDIARVNVAGEFMDLQAGGYIEEDVDVVAFADRMVSRYESLWTTLTAAQEFDTGERWRVDERIRALNSLGFDVDELAMTTDLDGTRITIHPKVVDAGHHQRRLLRLTGLDVFGEGQARRLLNDLDSYRAAKDRQNDDEQLVAQDWLLNVYHPLLRRIPRDLAGKMEPAEIFHEVLEHRWYMSEREQRDVTFEEALDDYVASVLRTRPDERALLPFAETEEMPRLRVPDA